MLLTLAEAADRLRVSVRTLEREAFDGRLAIVRVRSRRFIEPAELDRYIAAQRECPSERKAHAGKSESALAAARALSSVYRPAQPGKTRSRSNRKLGGGRSTLLRVVRSGA